MGFHAETTSLRASVPLADSAVVRPDGRWCARARALARHSLRCGARAAFAITRRPGRSRRLPRAGPAARSVRDGGHALVCESPQAPGIRRAGPGDWLSGRAPRSHRGGHWFDPSIAHPGTSRSVTRSDPRCLAFFGSCPVLGARRKPVFVVESGWAASIVSRTAAMEQQTPRMPGTSWPVRSDLRTPGMPASPKIGLAARQGRAALRKQQCLDRSGPRLPSLSCHSMRRWPLRPLPLLRGPRSHRLGAMSHRPAADPTRSSGCCRQRPPGPDILCNPHP